MIIDHTHRKYKQRRNNLTSDNQYNGAYYYSKEIVNNIIPLVSTTRNWVTVNARGYAFDHSIVFIHNNLNHEHYDWLKQYKDLVLVCGVPETCEKVSHLGKAIYLPLSIDTRYVKQFKLPKEQRHGAAFVGRTSKQFYDGVTLPEGIEFICGVPRQRLLQRMAKKEEVYAVGRVALEARCLGCEIKPYDPRFPDVSIWKVIDNADAAKILQKELDEIDGYSD